jgi:hypothetical protein
MVEPDWAALEDLDDNQLQATLLEYLDAVMAGRPAQAEDALVAALPRPLQVLWLGGGPDRRLGREAGCVRASAGWLYCCLGPAAQPTPANMITGPHPSTITATPSRATTLPTTAGMHQAPRSC